MQPDRATNNGGGTMEVVAGAPRCQLLLIMLMAAMLLPGMKVSPLFGEKLPVPSSYKKTSAKIAHCQQSMQGHFVAQWLTFATVKVNSICGFFNAHIFSEADWCYKLSRHTARLSFQLMLWFTQSWDESLHVISRGPILVLSK
ncbi:hypothetical protein STEG23_025332, partial [Scotinomys teguina]